MATMPFRAEDVLTHIANCARPLTEDLAVWLEDLSERYPYKWAQVIAFPPNLKKNPPQNSVEAEYPPNLKKNPPKNSVEAVPAESQKESAPKFCGVSSRRITKRIRWKILWSQSPPNFW